MSIPAVLVAAHTRETHTGAAQRWLTELSGPSLILSAWTLVDFQRCRLMCRRAAAQLRAGDSLHLAMALRLKATHFATLDGILATNASAHGLESPLGRPSARGHR